MVLRLNAEINKAVAEPDVTAKLKSVGIEPRSVRPRCSATSIIARCANGPMS